MDLDFWDCFGRKKTLSYTEEMNDLYISHCLCYVLPVEMKVAAAAAEAKKAAAKGNLC